MNSVPARALPDGPGGREDAGVEQGDVRPDRPPEYASSGKTFVMMLPTAQRTERELIPAP
jgi:hypothetical protein